MESSAPNQYVWNVNKLKSQPIKHNTEELSAPNRHAIASILA